MRTVRTICRGCHCECGAIVYVENEKVVKIEGDPEFPRNEGFLCPKGLAYTQLLYHPDRLKYPMKRIGDIKEGKWERFSWDEALDTIAIKMKEIKEKYGPESIAWEWGDGLRENELVNYLLLYSLGSPNTLHTDSHYCLQPQLLAEWLTYGDYVTGIWGPDYRNSKCILIWGANPFQSHPCLGRDIMLGLENGAKLIVVDPRLSETASKADLWLRVRPGTDAALALGMLHVIVNEELYCKEFVDKWCTGFDKLRKRVEKYPPSKVAEITWVPEKDIKRAARMYATHESATFHSFMGTTMSVNSIQTQRAFAIMVAISGNLDRKGGNLTRAYPPDYETYADLIRNRTRGLLPKKIENKRIGAKLHPLHRGADSPTWRDCHPPSAYRAILTGEPYPLKMIMIVNDPITGLEGSRKVMKALTQLEFLVVTDFFMSPTAKLADIVLPAATWLEKDSICDGHYEDLIAACPKVIEPLYECRDEKWICSELFKRLGLEPPIPILPEKLIDYRLKPLNMTYDELKEKHFVKFPIKYKKYEDKGFPTSSGKVELYSSLLAEHGYDPLPHYVEPPESPFSTPELAKKYPYILITGSRHIVYYHSAHRQIPWLRELVPDPVVEIHPKTAKERNIEEGDWVWIKTPHSKKRVKMRARLTSGIDPQVVHAYSHWWYPEKIDENYESACFDSNINSILSLDPPYEPIVGATPLRGRLCSIGRIGSD